MQLQHQFGSDITMALDVLAGFGADDAEQREAMRLTHAWLPRNVATFQDLRASTTRQRMLFGICQGGFDAERRIESGAFVAASGVDGCAIGGLSVGEPKEVMAEMLTASISALPQDKPRYLMGVGSPEDLWNGVAAGVDMFDCVLPTRVARRGALYLPIGRVDVTAGRFRATDAPIDDECDCYTCLNFSAAYVHHLFRARELLAYRLASIHNVRFLHRQIDRMRRSIGAGTFEHERQAFLSEYAPANQAVAAAQRAKFRSAEANRHASRT